MKRKNVKKQVFKYFRNVFKSVKNNDLRIDDLFNVSYNTLFYDKIGIMQLIEEFTGKPFNETCKITLRGIERHDDFVLTDKLKGWKGLEDIYYVHNLRNFHSRLIHRDNPKAPENSTAEQEIYFITNCHTATLE